MIDSAAYPRYWFGFRASGARVHDAAAVRGQQQRSARLEAYRRSRVLPLFRGRTLEQQRRDHYNDQEIRLAELAVANSQAQGA